MARAPYSGTGKVWKGGREKGGRGDLIGGRKKPPTPWGLGLFWPDNRN